jgi:hypothetical protein
MVGLRLLRSLVPPYSLTLTLFLRLTTLGARVLLDENDVHAMRERKGLTSALWSG